MPDPSEFFTDPLDAGERALAEERCRLLQSRVTILEGELQQLRGMFTINTEKLGYVAGMLGFHADESIQQIAAHVRAKLQKAAA
jgi:hypothetical protein